MNRTPSRRQFGFRTAHGPKAMRAAGWCPECKEALHECVCTLDEPVDFETPRTAWMVRDDMDEFEEVP